MFSIKILLHVENKKKSKLKHKQKQKHLAIFRDSKSYDVAKRMQMIKKKIHGKLSKILVCFMDSSDAYILHPKIFFLQNHRKKRLNEMSTLSHCKHW